MANAIALYQGMIRPRLVEESESFRAPDGRVSSYYLNLNSRHDRNQEAVRVSLKDALAEQRKRIEGLQEHHAVHMALRRDWEQVETLANTLIGERFTVSLACFVASDSGYSRALPLPWPVRNRAFFEDRFVLWPLRQVLDQADRYGILLSDKEEARMLLFSLEQIEDVTTIMDVIPGRIRFPDPLGELKYRHKHTEHFHRHFKHVAQVALQHFRREPVEHLIIGGLWDTLPQFEGYLHPYLRDRIVTRWKIDVSTPTQQVLQRALEEEQRYLEEQAQGAWKIIQELRPQRGALGLDEVLSNLWQRRVQVLLLEPNAIQVGFRCSTCGRLQLGGGPCAECGGKVVEVPDVFEEAVHEAVEQSAQVRFWEDPALRDAGSIAALKRF